MNLSTLNGRPRRILYLCDWLPPDFGAVGQYSLHFARERAAAGHHVVLAGLSSRANSIERHRIGPGNLSVLRLHAKPYDRSDFARRIVWTMGTNARLLWHTREQLRKADEVIFTGSPPFMVHFLAPLNLSLRKRLVYRITDFHPECLMAAMDNLPLALKLFHRMTVLWRRTVQHFEVLGEDQRLRLQGMGIGDDRITLKRDPCPVDISDDVTPLPVPAELRHHVVLLYSGNFGVAHDHETFVEGYDLHHRSGSGRVGLWLNAIGRNADLVEQELHKRRLPVYRSRPVPLDDLPRLLVTPDAHLITLRDAFVGYVLPSKVYGCIESFRDVLYVGSKRSDIHLLCSSGLPRGAYHQVEVGDPNRVAQALETVADRSRPRSNGSKIRFQDRADSMMVPYARQVSSPVPRAANV